MSEPKVRSELTVWACPYLAKAPVSEHLSIVEGPSTGMAVDLHWPLVSVTEHYTMSASDKEVRVLWRCRASTGYWRCKYRLLIAFADLLFALIRWWQMSWKVFPERDWHFQAYLLPFSGSSCGFQQRLAQPHRALNNACECFVKLHINAILCHLKVHYVVLGKTF